MTRVAVLLLFALTVSVRHSVGHAGCEDDEFCGEGSGNDDYHDDNDDEDDDDYHDDDGDEDYHDDDDDYHDDDEDYHDDDEDYHDDDDNGGDRSELSALVEAGLIQNVFLNGSIVVQPFWRWRFQD